MTSRPPKNNFTSTAPKPPQPSHTVTAATAKPHWLQRPPCYNQSHREARSSFRVFPCSSVVRVCPCLSVVRVRPCCSVVRVRPCSSVVRGVPCLSVCFRGPCSSVCFRGPCWSVFVRGPCCSVVRGACRDGQRRLGGRCG